LTKGSDPVEANATAAADGGVGADGSGDGAVLRDEAAEVPVESTEMDVLNLGGSTDEEAVAENCGGGGGGGPCCPPPVEPDPDNNCCGV